jgi:hypothetical protein
VLGMGMRRGTWVLLGALAVGLVFVGAARAGAPGEKGRERLADRLLRRDPGAAVGGNTQVATAVGARVFGVPGRMNFIMALGPRERIVGGSDHDELGALGDAARISGGAGPDLIHGGPGNGRLDGGPGNDLIYANTRGDTTVSPGSGTNQVNVADGHGGDRLICAAGSINHITADRGDRIARSCRGERSNRRYLRLSGGHPSAHAAQATSGSGTDASPFTAECNPPEPSTTDCKIQLWSESLSKLWTHAGVPAMQCPASHPWLNNTDYVPFGTSVPFGVEIGGLGPTGVSIQETLTDSGVFATGTGTVNASATNWTNGTNTYTVYLHCTDNTDERY